MDEYIEKECAECGAVIMTGDDLFSYDEEKDDFVPADIEEDCDLFCAGCAGKNEESEEEKEYVCSSCKHAFECEPAFSTFNSFFGENEDFCPECAKKRREQEEEAEEAGLTINTYIAVQDGEMSIEKAEKLSAMADYRHNQTDYDSLLAAGIDRQDTREAIKIQKEG